MNLRVDDGVTMIEGKLSLGTGGLVSGSRGVLGGGLVFGFIGVLGNTFVFDISDKSIFVVSGVGHGLDTAIGKVDTVRT